MAAVTKESYILTDIDGGMFKEHKIKVELYTLNLTNACSILLITYGNNLHKISLRMAIYNNIMVYYYYY